MPKSKGTPGGNPFPVQTPEFLAHVKPRPADLPDGISLGKPVCVALPEDADVVVRELPNRSEWLRRVITEAARRELMGNDSEPAIATPVDNPTTRKRKGR